jgi:hypothetical protein
LQAIDQKKRPHHGRFFFSTFLFADHAGDHPITGSNGTINKATMLIILISGLIAGPAVSL